MLASELFCKCFEVLEFLSLNSHKWNQSTAVGDSDQTVIFEGVLLNLAKLQNVSAVGQLGSWTLDTPATSEEDKKALSLFTESAFVHTVRQQEARLHIG